MPKLDGYQVLTLIRSHEHTRRLPSIPVITITGRTSDDDRADALAGGFAAHLSKPVFVNELRDALDRASTLRDALHRTRYTRDISSVDERIRHLFPLDVPDRLQAVAGLALALEQQGRDLLRQSLLRAMHGNPDAAHAPLIRLSEIASAIGAHGARELCSELADKLASGGLPMETAAVLLRAEIDRLIFTLRERVLR